MATSNVNETLVLSKEVKHGLKLMRTACSYVLGQTKLTFPRQYKDWLRAMDETDDFFNELDYREKLELAAEQKEVLTANPVEVINLNNLLEASGQLIDILENINQLNEKINNFKYQYENLGKLPETINKKTISLISEEKI